MTAILNTVLALLAQIAPVLGSTSTIASVINALVNIIPALIQEYNDLVPIVKDIIAALSANSAAGSAAPSNSARNIGVFVVPGQTALTRIPHDASSAAALRVIARIAPFVAVYAT